MIDFILAGLVCMGVMFIVFFCLSLATVSLSLALAHVVKRGSIWMRYPIRPSSQ